MDQSLKGADIAEDLGISRATFYNHLKVLIDTDHVTVKRGGRNRPNRYHITETGRKALEHGYRRRA
jgi:predicted ArsR family transcriptional regulator